MEFCSRIIIYFAASLIFIILLHNLGGFVLFYLSKLESQIILFTERNSKNYVHQ